MDDTGFFLGLTTYAMDAAGYPGRDGDWRIAVEGFDPTRERSAETLLTLANGYAGTRGSLEEGHAACRSGTFLA